MILCDPCNPRWLQVVQFDLGRDSTGTFKLVTCGKEDVFLSCHLQKKNLNTAQVSVLISKVFNKKKKKAALILLDFVESDLVNMEL